MELTYIPVVVWVTVSSSEDDLISELDTCNDSDDFNLIELDTDRDRE